MLWRSDLPSLLENFTGIPAIFNLEEGHFHAFPLKCMLPKKFQARPKWRLMDLSMEAPEATLERYQDGLYSQNTDL